MGLKLYDKAVLAFTGALFFEPYEALFHENIAKALLMTGG